MKKLLVRSLALIVLLSLPAAAQSPCMDWSGDFALPGFDGPPTRYRTLDDGSGSKLYAMGGFTHVNGVAANLVARFDGATWSALPSGSGGMTPTAILDLAMFDDGQGGGPALYAGGGFTQPGGANFYGVAKRTAGPPCQRG